MGDLYPEDMIDDDPEESQLTMEEVSASLSMLLSRVRMLENTKTTMLTLVMRTYSPNPDSIDPFALMLLDEQKVFRLSIADLLLMFQLAGEGEMSLLSPVTRPDAWNPGVKMTGPRGGDLEGEGPARFMDLIISRAD